MLHALLLNKESYNRGRCNSGLQGTIILKVIKFLKLVKFMEASLMQERWAGFRCANLLFCHKSGPQMQSSYVTHNYPRCTEGKGFGKLDSYIKGKETCPGVFFCNLYITNYELILQLPLPQLLFGKIQYHHPYNSSSLKYLIVYLRYFWETREIAQQLAS